MIISKILLRLYEISFWPNSGIWLFWILNSGILYAILRSWNEKLGWIYIRSSYKTKDSNKMKPVNDCSNSIH